MTVSEQLDLGGGFFVEPWTGDTLNPPALQGHDAPLRGHATLRYAEHSDNGALCLNVGFIASAMEVVAVLELLSGSRMWIWRAFGRAYSASVTGTFDMTTWSTFPSSGDLDLNRPDLEVTLTPKDAVTTRAIRLLLDQDEPRSRIARLALNRWQTARRRLEHADAIIDTWIAIEALFIKAGSKRLRGNKKGEHAATRIQGYLRVPPGGGQRLRSLDHDGLTLYDQALNAYKVRNAIVRGEIVDSPTLYDTRWHLEWILARSLNLLLVEQELCSFDPSTLDDDCSH